MIVLNLLCGNQHRFEGWFASNDDFSRQQATRQVNCPVCRADEVLRLPAAPRVRRYREGNSQVAGSQPAQDVPPAESMAAVVRRLMAGSENVGDRFPEEARKIHYAEVAPRKIHGKTTPAQTLELLAEGVPVLPLPLPPDSDLH